MKEMYKVSVELGKHLNPVQFKMVWIGETETEVILGKEVVNQMQETIVPKEQLGVIQSNDSSLDENGLYFYSFCEKQQVPEVRKRLIEKVEQKLLEVEKLVSTMKENWEDGNYTVSRFERTPVGIEENEWLTDWKFEHKLSENSTLFSYKSIIHSEKRYVVVTDFIVQAEFSEFSMKPLHDYLDEHFPETRIQLR